VKRTSKKQEDTK